MSEQSDRQKSTTEQKPPALTINWDLVSKLFYRSLKMGAAFGSLQVFFYYLTLRYNPIDSLASLGAVAGLVAGISILLAVVLFCLWALPAYWLAVLVGQPGTERTYDWFLVPPQASTSRPEPAPPRSSLARMTLFAGATFGLPWLALFAMMLPRYFGMEAGSNWMAPLLAGMALLLSIPYMLDLKQLRDVKDRFTSKGSRREFCRSVLWPRLAVVTVSLLTATFPMLAFGI